MSLSSPSNLHLPWLNLSLDSSLRNKSKIQYLGPSMGYERCKIYNELSHRSVQFIFLLTDQMLTTNNYYVAILSACLLINFINVGLLLLLL